MTTTTKPAQRTSRLWAKMALLPVLLVSLLAACGYSGTLSARDLLLESDSAIDNTGGEIRARRILYLKSGGDIINDSTTGSASGSSANSAWRKETIDRRGRIILDGEGGEEDNSQGYLSLYAGENIESRTGDIENRNSGSQSYLSGKNVHFDVRTLDNRFTLNSGGQSRLGAPGRDYLSTRVATDHGSHIEGKGNIFIHAREGKVHGLGMQINSADGTVAIYGRDGVDLKNGWEERDLISSQYDKGRRIIGRKENETYREEHSKSAIPGLISGKQVAIVAGYDPENHTKQNGHADVNLTGIYAVSDNGTLLKAGHNVTVSAAEETYRTDYRDYQRKSGLFYSLQNPLSVETGRREWDNRNKGHGKHYAPSLVGALDGNVVIEADNHYQNNGSIIHASRQENLGPVASKAELAAMTDAERDAYWDKRMKAGNVIIRAKSAAETALVADHHNEQENRFQSRGLKIGLIGGAADNINATASNLYTLSHTGNSRVKAMAAGLAAYNLQQSMMQFQQGGKGGAGGGGNTKIAITYGVSKSKSETKSDWQSVQAAQTTADGTVYMQVRGGGENSTYTNTGSDIGGGERTVFDVEGKKTFQSVLTNQHLRNDNRSWEAHGGIAFDRNTIGVNAGGAIAGGYYEGTEGLHRLSRVGTLTGHTDLGEGKTTLHGAQVFGRSIRARTEDLTIISPQGTGRERGMQYSLGADVTVGYGGASGSVDVNYSRLQGDYKTVNAESGARDAADGLNGSDARSQDLANNIHTSDAAYNATHAWRSGQSGIYAGEDGYDIRNIGTVDLQGGVILSDAERSKNYLKTDHFTYRDVENFAKGKAIGINPHFGMSINRDQTSEVDKQLNERYRKGEDGKVHNEDYRMATPNRNDNPIKFGTGSGDVHGNDRYIFGKILASNLLGSGMEKRSEHGTSRALISDGIFDIGSAEGRQNMANITKVRLDDYQAAHRTITPVNAQALQKKLDENITFRHGQLFQQFLQPGMDEVYHSQFIAEHRLMTYELDADGKPIDDPERIARIKQEGINKGINPEDYLKEQQEAGVNTYKLREVKDSERAHLKKATIIDPRTGQPTQRYVIAVNGIFNDVQAAAKYASQNYVATNGENGQPNGRVYKNIYFIHNPPAQSRIGELMTAVYQKVFEGNIGSLGNSTIQVRDLMLRYGRDDLLVGSHSRGTTVVHNGVDDLARDPANRGALSGTELKMVGPATHVANADRQYVYLQGDSATPRHIQIENNANDFVGSQIGGNPPTMHDAPPGQGWWGSIPDIFGSPASAHNCYGLGNQTCREMGYRQKHDDDTMRPMQTIDQLPQTPWGSIFRPFKPDHSPQHDEGDKK